MPEINFPDTNDFFDGFTVKETFAVVITAIFTVPTAGDYTFFLSSDDGSTLKLDGDLVVYNGGEHPFTEKTGTITLEATEYFLEVLFFENS